MQYSAYKSKILASYKFCDNYFGFFKQLSIFLQLLKVLFNILSSWKSKNRLKFLISGGYKYYERLNSCPVRVRTWTFLNQNQTCCQLHYGTIFLSMQMYKKKEKRGKKKSKCKIQKSKCKIVETENAEWI